LEALKKKQRDRDVEGTTWDQANLIKGPSIGADHGVGAFPQILDLSKSEEQSDLEQNMDPLDKLIIKQVGS